jgi:hypothetical protein
MLWSGGRVSRSFLAITFVKAIDASCGIDQLLFPGKERVASRTYFDVQVTFASRASLERFAARAGDRDFNVFGVNSWFHLLLRHSLSAAPGRNFQTFYDMWTVRYRQVYRGFFTRGAKRKVQELRLPEGFLWVFAPLREEFFVFLSQKTPSA